MTAAAYPPATLPWWKSRVLIGAIVSAVCKALVVFGVVAEVAPADEAEFAELATLVASLIGDAIVAHARLTQKYAPPITAGASPAIVRNIPLLFLSACILPALTACASGLQVAAATATHPPVVAAAADLVQAQGTACRIEAAIKMAKAVADAVQAAEAERCRQAARAAAAPLPKD